MRTQTGFSLIELLIVVAIILIIAAIAIPNLMHAKMSANESSAAAGLHVLQTAELTYNNSYPAIGYANGIAELGGANPCTPAPATACIIDNFLATATPGSGGKSGYYYQATGTVSGGATFNTAYIVAAAPITVNSTGNRDFCSTNDVVLRAQLATAGDLPVTSEAACVAYPATP
jgi:type IV pilus assembly protein PilA